MTALDATRQLDFLPPEKVLGCQISLIGAGAIGSWTALALGKMLAGYPGFGGLQVIDPDSVESVNIPGQFYRVADGDNHRRRRKVDALRDNLETHCGLQIDAMPQFLQADSKVQLSDIAITGVDSMSSRRAIWELIRHQRGVRYLIDARMGAFHISILTAKIDDPASEREYLQGLVEDTATMDLPCTGRAIVTVAMTIAGICAEQVRKILIGVEPPRRIDFNLETNQLLVCE